MEPPVIVTVENWKVLVSPTTEPPVMMIFELSMGSKLEPTTPPSTKATVVGAPGEGQGASLNTTHPALRTRTKSLE